MASNDSLFKEIIIHLKEKGFIFQGSEIYSGLANTWDYGPLGVKLKNNIKQQWWNFFVEKNQYNVGLDSSILMNSKVWTASGHLSNFSDPLIDCKSCKARFRADNLINVKRPDIIFDGWSSEKLEKFIVDNHIKCLKCNQEDWTSIRQFQLMFETHQGVIKDEHNKIYLRPETAQGIFINFNNVRKSVNQKIPFGIGQIGKSFRNEITPSNFIFRTREFEQMELEFFFIPQNQNDNTWFDYWVNQCKIFLASVGLSNSKNLSFKQHEPNQLAHYALATTDIEYNFPFGMSELCGICNRGNYDLTKHSESSGVKMEVQDPNVATKKMVIPSVIEPSMGVERLLLALICEAYTKEVLTDGRQRIVLKLDKNIVPFQVAIMPSNKNKFGALATKIFDDLKYTQLKVIYETAANVGKSYRYQDGIGTMYCVTVDYATEEQGTVTVRDRNTTQQEIVPLSSLKKYLYNKLDIIC
ncbi:glycine--tRNA ligase [Spiroplasma sp. AdecLV25b]|uniref:glycine--tRNA ligase n=1 Tax=Spiroplasma sp. AdecLV25b TaxID=3027162 RepID=UPI0027E1E5DB|nr:glycine--tRNA ligase [Spiroplasma sp. AdecLV25b]